MGKGIQIAAVALTVFGGLAWLLANDSGGAGSFRYYSSVSDYLDSGPDSSADGSGSRVHGFVADGSISKQLAAGHVDFEIRDDSATLRVRYLGIDVPDLFDDGAEVVVEGRLEDGLFLADRLLAKCPSRYEVEPEAGAPV